MTTSQSPQPGDQDLPRPYPGHPPYDPQGYPYRYGYAPQQPVYPPPQHGYAPPPPYSAPPGAIPPQWARSGTGPQPPQPPKKKGGKAKWVIGTIVALIVIGMAFGGNDESTTTTAAPAAAPAAPVAESAPAAPSVAAAPAEQPYNGYGQASGTYGQEILAGGLAVTADAPEKISQQYIGTQWCADVSYRNTGTTQESFSPFDWKFRTSDGVEVNASIPFNADNALNSGQLAPGGNVSGQVCADTQTTNVNSVVFNPGFGIMHEVAWTE